MFIDFDDLTNNTERVVREVCSFIGAAPELYKHMALAPGMKVLLRLSTVTFCKPFCATE